jgi:hypothetical protein
MAFLWKFRDYFHFYLSVFETESHYIAQVGLELLDSNNPPASASGVVATIDVCHCAQLFKTLLFKSKSSGFRELIFSDRTISDLLVRTKE